MPACVGYELRVFVCMDVLLLSSRATHTRAHTHTRAWWCRQYLRLVWCSFPRRVGCVIPQASQVWQDFSAQLGGAGDVFQALLAKLHVGGKSNELYLLNSTIEATSSATLSVRGAASSLKKMSMTTTFELNDMETGKTLFADTVSGYATLGSVFSFYGQDKSESHARERLAVLLAQRVGRRLQLYFLEQNQ